MHDLVKALRVLFEPWSCLHSYMVPKDDTRDQSDGRYRQQIVWHKKHFKNTMKENLRWPHFTGWPDPHRGSSTVCCNVTATQPQAAFSLQPSLPQPVQQLTWQYHSSIRHGSPSLSARNHVCFQLVGCMWGCTQSIWHMHKPWRAGSWPLRVTLTWDNWSQSLKEIHLRPPLHSSSEGPSGGPGAHSGDQPHNGLGSGSGLDFPSFPGSLSQFLLSWEHMPKWSSYKETFAIDSVFVGGSGGWRGEESGSGFRLRKSLKTKRGVEEFHKSSFLQIACKGTPTLIVHFYPFR